MMIFENRGSIEKNKGFFSVNYENFYDVVLYKELGLTQLILANGWNINSILEKYRDQDYRTLQTNINTTGEDPLAKPY